MASTDIDGSVMVILSEKEARVLYSRLIGESTLTEIEQIIVRKIARDLELEGNMKGFNKQEGTWRLSNEQLTIRVLVDSDNNVQAVAPVAFKFIGQPFNNLTHWMERMSKTDIIALKDVRLKIYEGDKDVREP